MSIRIVCPVGGLKHTRFYTNAYVLYPHTVTETGEILKRSSVSCGDGGNRLNENHYASGELSVSASCAICGANCRIHYGKKADSDAIKSLPPALRPQVAASVGTIPVSGVGIPMVANVIGTPGAPAPPAAGNPIFTPILDAPLGVTEEEQSEEQNEEEEVEHVAYEPDDPAHLHDDDEGDDEDDEEDEEDEDNQ